MAGRARDLADVAVELRMHRLGDRVLVFLEEDRAHARDRRAPVGGAAVARVVGHLDLGGAHAVEQGVLHLLGQVLPRRVGVHAEVLAHRRHDLRVVVGVAEDAAEDAARHREGRVLDQRLGVHDTSRAQTVAVGAGTVGRVEGEITRLQIADGVAVDGAGQVEGVLQQLARHRLGVVAIGQQVETHLAVGQPGRLLHGLGDAAQRVLADDHTVHDDLDRVLVFLIELDLVRAQLAHLAVHAHAAEALLGQVLEELGVLALAAEHDRRQDVRAAPLARSEDLVGHLVGRLPLDHATALGTVRHAHAREEQAQVVVDLRDGTDRRARVAAGGLLVDGDRGAQAVDTVEVGLVHLAEELARVAREALDVAALALRVDRVEGQARLARTREPRDHDETVARDGDVDVAQVVLARAADDDGIRCHMSYLERSYAENSATGDGAVGPSRKRPFICESDSNKRPGHRLRHPGRVHPIVPICSMSRTGEVTIPRPLSPCHEGDKPRPLSRVTGSSTSRQRGRARGAWRLLRPPDLRISCPASLRAARA